MSETTPVIVVGAGLAGLACALHLQRAGVACRVLEASDGIGGRIRTDELDGFLLDRGFQVLLTAYPEARAVLDLDALDLRPFRPGALVRFGGAFHRLGDPFRRPADALPTLAAPIGSFGDKIRIPGLRARCTRGDLDAQMTAPEMPTVDFLRDAGLGDAIIDSFFRPFLGGVFLEPHLVTSSRMFRFVFRMFAHGDAAVPATGMQAIPAQLAARLEDGTVRLHSPVASIAAGRVVLDGGEELHARHVVVATDGSTAHSLVGGVRDPEWNAVSNVYFEAERAPIEEPILILDGEGRGPTNNLSVPTRVAPGHGPEGRELVSASAIGSHAADPELVDRMRDQLRDWFGDEVDGWRHLRTYRIDRALPRQPVGWLEPAERELRQDGVIVAGDHLDTASTNGALASGRRAAEMVLDDLDVSGR